MCLIRKPEKITTESPQRERARVPSNVLHSAWFYRLMFIVCCNKSQVVSAGTMNSGNKTKHQKKLQWMRMAVTHFSFANLIFFSFSKVSSIINSEKHVRARVQFMLSPYHIFNIHISKIILNDVRTKWLNVNNDKIEKPLCKDWQVRFIFMRWKKRDFIGNVSSDD